jgi:hypothetical protein
MHMVLAGSMWSLLDINALRCTDMVFSIDSYFKKGETHY